MGSGKGQARRAKAQVTLRVKDVVDQEAWRTFVTSQKLKTETLAQYYLGWQPQGQRLRRNELEKIISELFQDLVVVGAIVLPSGATADDYDFAIRDEESPAREGLF